MKFFAILFAALAIFSLAVKSMRVDPNSKSYRLRTPPYNGGYEGVGFNLIGNTKNHGGRHAKPAQKEKVIEKKA